MACIITDNTLFAHWHIHELNVCQVAFNITAQ
jgi:hypothetical protein